MLDTPRASQITEADLRAHFHLPLQDVAAKMGLCVTLLKKVCRRHGIQRWPYRQIRSISKLLEDLKSARESEAPDGPSRRSLDEQIRELELQQATIMNNPNFNVLAHRRAQHGRRMAPPQHMDSPSSASSGSSGGGHAGFLSGSNPVSSAPMHAGSFSAAMSAAMGAQALGMMAQQQSQGQQPFCFPNPAAAAAAAAMMMRPGMPSHPAMQLGMSLDTSFLHTPGTFMPMMHPAQAQTQRGMKRAAPTDLHIFTRPPLLDPELRVPVPRFADPYAAVDSLTHFCITSATC